MQCDDRLTPMLRAKRRGHDTFASRRGPGLLQLDTILLELIKGTEEGAAQIERLEGF